VAETEGRGHHTVRALTLFHEAREAALLNRFPAQQSLALAQIAESLGAIGKQAEANEIWDSAVDLAKKAQHGGGTDGPEAAGVLLSAVGAFCKSRRMDAAKSVANGIVFDSLRERAFQIIERVEEG
jgi:hypothetical protein